MEQTNISQLSTIELKAIAYDTMAQIELSHNNLRIINQELARRVQAQNPIQESNVVGNLAPINTIKV